MIYLFNSTDFILFFISVFSIYWILPKKFKNTLLLAASYIFYASWNWKLLGLLLISTFTNYFLGLWIHNAENNKSKKLFLILAIIFNLSLLGFFKYFNFFAESLVSLLNLFGFNLNFTTLNIILPIGISFYTFRTMSYTIDIYRKQLAPTKNIIDFSLFDAYFPQLISGPIERAKNLIPKIQAEKQIRNINYKEGLYLFVYGLFKKVVVADSVASIVNNIFALPNPSGAQVLIAAYAFAIQIYADFSGYIDMARGISHFFGIELSTNFNLPYFAKNPRDFWRRWNITLSSWVRDYVYIPLGGKHSRFLGMYALFITWLIMGLWHGAAWNFVLWGLYWFLLIMIYRIVKYIFQAMQLLKTKNNVITTFKNWMMTILMFHLTTYGWILFRSENFGQITAFTRSLFSGINILELFNISYLYLYAIIVFMAIYEMLQYYKNDQVFIYKKSFYYQLAFYMTLFFLYIEIGAISNIEFIYFQF